MIDVKVYMIDGKWRSKLKISDQRSSFKGESAKAPCILPRHRIAPFYLLISIEELPIISFSRFSLQ